MKILGVASLALAICTLTSDLFAQNFDVDTIIWSGRTDNRVNLVILGDGYQSHELKAFDTAAIQLADYVLRQKPMDAYKKYFNVFSIRVPSNESGAALDPSMLIDNYYGSTYNFAGIDRLLVPTKSAKARNVLINNFPEYDQVMMVVNHTKYGGSGGWMATTSIHNSAPEIAAHEVGHSFSNLRDEYWAGPQYARESLNMTQQTNPDSVIWTNWIGDFQVGVYSFTEDTTWHRPHQNCKMRRLGPEFCSVCKEAFVEKVHKLVDAVDSYDPILSDQTIRSGDTLTFTLDLIEPSPNSLKVEWYLDGEIIGSDSAAQTLLADEFHDGQNLLEAYVLDTTVYSRWNDNRNRMSWVQWNIEKQISTSITGKHGILSYKVWPNPTSEIIHLTIQGEADVYLWTIGGQLVEQRRIESGDHMFQLPKNTGTNYLLKINFGGKEEIVPILALSK
jgi:hypothetical protein